jgi:hypothetical protein
MYNLQPLLQLVEMFGMRHFARKENKNGLDTDSLTLYIEDTVLRYKTWRNCSTICNYIN